MTSLDHWDASQSKHVYCSILWYENIHSICIGLVSWYHISELATIIKWYSYNTDYDNNRKTVLVTH